MNTKIYLVAGLLAGLLVAVSIGSYRPVDHAGVINASSANWFAPGDGLVSYESATELNLVGFPFTVEPHSCYVVYVARLATPGAYTYIFNGADGVSFTVEENNLISNQGIFETTDRYNVGLRCDDRGGYEYSEIITATVSGASKNYYEINIDTENSKSQTLFYSFTGSATAVIEASGAWGTRITATGAVSDTIVYVESVDGLAVGRVVIVDDQRRLISALDLDTHSITFSIELTDTVAILDPLYVAGPWYSVNKSGLVLTDHSYSNEWLSGTGAIELDFEAMRLRLSVFGSGDVWAAVKGRR